MFRLNTKLESQGLTPMTDLVKDFSNGVKLIEVSFFACSIESPRADRISCWYVEQSLRDPSEY